LIASAGNRLWKELVGSNPGPMKVTNVSLAFTGIETAEEGQQNIDEFFKMGAPGRVSKRPREERHSVESRPSIGESSSSTDSENHSTTFFCDECNRKFSLSTKFLSPSVSREEIRHALDAMKNEHDDFHFAQSVAREIEPDEPSLPKPPKKKAVKDGRKPPKPPTGIEKFFPRQ